MSKPVKALIANELRTRFGGLESACVVELTGLSVQAQEQLRGKLREKAARLQVVKNSLARQAFQGTALAPLGEAMQGPCALVTAKDSLVEVAKLLVEAAKEFTQLKLKYAIVDGDPQLLSVEAVSKMRSRLELLGDVAMLLASPGRRLAGCLASPQSKIAGCLKAMAEKEAA